MPAAPWPSCCSPACGSRSRPPPPPARRRRPRPPPRPPRPPPPPPPPPAPPAPPAAAAAAEPQALPACGDCHADQAKALRVNAHGHGKAAKGEEIPNRVCESCHGDGKAHIEAGGDKAWIVKPAGLAGADKFCLPCHDVLSDRLSRHAGAHANSAT